MAADKLRRTNIPWKQARVTVVLLLALVIGAYATYQVGRFFNVFSDRYELVTLVESVAGLMEGAPVSLAGQRVGQVDDIEFIPIERQTGPYNLLVRLSVDRGLQSQIRADSRAFIRTQGLLGDKFVDITPGTASQPVLEEGDTVPTSATAGMDELLAGAGAMMEQASALVTDLSTIAGAVAEGRGTLGLLLADEQLYGRLVAATAELQTTVRTLNRSEGTFGRLLRDPRLYDQLQTTLARLDTVTYLIADEEGSLGRLVRTDSLYRSMADVVAGADSAVTDLAAVMDRLANGDGSVQKLLADPALYDQLLRAVTDLHDLLAEIRQEPKKYLPDVRVDVF